jgi:hypothetical protein
LVKYARPGAPKRFAKQPAEAFEQQVTTAAVDA